MAAIRDDSNRVREWEAGLPSVAELTPLSKSLISRVLARAFCIPPPPSGPAPGLAPEDVDRASKSTLQLLRRKAAASPAFALPSIDPYSPSSAAPEDGADEEAAARAAAAARRGAFPGRGGGGWEGDEAQEREEEEACGVVGGPAGFWPAVSAMAGGPPGGAELGRGGGGGGEGGRGGGFEGGSESAKGASLQQQQQQKARKLTDGAESEDVDSADGPDGSAARTLKRPRLVWTPQLHKRFVDAVGHLGLKNAVPKTIMQLMNVEGLTRENVASHLQKYRLYLKRMQGLCTEGPSASDPLFASAPLPLNLTSQHFLPNPHHSRAAENGSSGTFSPPAVPLPRAAQGMFQSEAVRGGSMGHGAAAAAAATAMQHFGGYEHQSHNFGMQRTGPQRPANLHRDLLVNAHAGQPPPLQQQQQQQAQVPPSHRVLTLFPQSGH